MLTKALDAWRDEELKRVTGMLDELKAAAAGAVEALGKMRDERDQAWTDGAVQAKAYAAGVELLQQRLQKAAAERDQARETGEDLAIRLGYALVNQYKLQQSLTIMEGTLQRVEEERDNAVEMYQRAVQCKIA